MQKKIKLLVMDVDGTLTDGKIYMSESGEAMKAFDIKDGYGINEILPQLGIIPVIITGRSSKIVENRARELRITEIHQGVHNKLRKLKEVAAKYNASQGEVAYVGDDLIDLECIEYCGLSACPADAIDEVKSACNYVCKHMAGNGAVREFIQVLLDGVDVCYFD